MTNEQPPLEIGIGSDGRYFARFRGENNGIGVSIHTITFDEKSARWLIKALLQILPSDEVRR